MSVHARAERATLLVRPQLRVGSTSDPAEAEADELADRVMRMPQPATALRRCAGGRTDGDEVRRQPSEEDEDDQELRGKPASGGGMLVDGGTEARIRSRQQAGSPLPSGTRQFFESRLGADLSSVRVHADAAAGELATRMQAKAFTVGRDVFFATGEYSPATRSGRQLLAHELAHTLQARAPRAHPSSAGTRVRRAIELRPPGRGEASAFDRRQELVDRLNATSSAVTYSLAADDRTLRYEVHDAPAMDRFDRMMTGFIDAARLIPLRLITSAGRVRNAAGTFVPLTADSFVAGYVDLDDLLGSSDTGFKLLLAHFITERMQVPNYARRIGTAGLVPLFDRAHQRGREAEAELLQDLLNDPSIRHNYDEPKPGGTTFVRAFRSRDEGYRVFYVLRGHGQRAVVSITQIRVVDGSRRLSLEDFIAERAAAAAPAAAP